MLYIGSHVGYKKDDQLVGSVNEAIKYNSNCFMFYTGAPQNTIRSSINIDLLDKAKILMKENNIDYDHVIVHAPYIINLASFDDTKFDFACNFLSQELDRCEKLGIKKLVLHPGAHVGKGEEYGLNRIVSGLNKVLGKTDVTIMLETMAGKGSELGKSIDEIKYLIDNVNDKNHIGVCLDTCHLNDSGVNLEKFDDYLDEFDKKIGINYIKAIHINDSKNEIGTHKDRHENIGFGTIGFNTLINIIYNDRLGDIPRILETPYIDKKYPPYKFEIDSIRNKEFNNNMISDIRDYYE